MSSNWEGNSLVSQFEEWMADLTEDLFSFLDEDKPLTDRHVSLDGEADGQQDGA